MTDLLGKRSRCQQESIEHQWASFRLNEDEDQDSAPEVSCLLDAQPAPVAMKRQRLYSAATKSDFQFLPKFKPQARKVASDPVQAELPDRKRDLK